MIHLCIFIRINNKNLIFKIKEKKEYALFTFRIHLKHALRTWLTLKGKQEKQIKLKIRSNRT